jgi:hypothetical protein
MARASSIHGQAGRTRAAAFGENALLGYEYRAAIKLGRQQPTHRRRLPLSRLHTLSMGPRLLRLPITQPAPCVSSQLAREISWPAQRPAAGERTHSADPQQTNPLASLALKD